MTALMSNEHDDENGPIEAEMMYVTPELAMKWLAHNENRPERAANVTYFVKLMEQDLFVFTPDPITFETVGRQQILRNGQHRLRAITLTGKAQWMLVVRGVPPETMLAMDMGKKRNFGDYLALRFDQADRNQVASVVRLAYLYDIGQPDMIMSGGGNEIPPARLLDWYVKHPEVKDAQLFGCVVGKGSGFSRTSIAVAKMLFDEIDDQASELFFERLRTGAFLSIGDPILTAREWLARRRGSRTMVTPRPAEQLAVLIKTWNDWRTGRTRKMIKYNRNTEEFPKPLRFT